MDTPLGTTEEAIALAPVSLGGQLSDGFAEVLDALVNIESMMSSLTAYRAQLVDDARRLAELAITVRTTEPHAWSTERVAYKSLISELAAALRIPQRTAEILVHRSQALVDGLPGTVAALREGAISYRHAEKVADQAFSLPREAWAGFEEAVLPAAKKLTVVKFDQKARKIRELVHPESITERAEKSAADRSVTLDPSEDGMMWLTAFLPAVQAKAIHNRITDIAVSLHCPEDERTIAQIRADVFADLLIDGDTITAAMREVSGDVGSDDIAVTGISTRGIRAQVNVTVPVMTLLGKGKEPGSLDGYGPIPPEIARELAAHAPSFMRILTHPETGVVLSVGRARYRPPADLQAWVRMRDGTCRHPGCNIPARRADIDHTNPWADGGETSADNLACLCPRDHDLKHHTGWTVKQIGGGKLEWTAPLSGRVYITDADTDLPS